MNDNQDISKKGLKNQKVLADFKIYNNIFNKTNGSIYIVQDGKIVFHNPFFAILTGYTSKELNKIDFIDLVHPKDKKLIKLLFSHNFREINQKNSGSYTFRVSHKTGEMRWFKSNVSIINWNGKPALLDNCFDITQQKEFEVKLVEEEKNFRLLVNAFEDMIFIISKNDTIIQANRSVYERLGFEESQVLLKSFSRILSESDNQHVKKMLSQALQGSRINFNCNLQTSAGKSIPVETRLFCGNWSQKEVVFAICQDITQRLEAERNIKLSEEKFSKAFETNAVMMTISTLEEGKYIDVNETFLKITGLKRNEVIGKTSLQLKIFPDIYQRKELLKLIETKGKAKDLETIMINKRGKKVICQFSVEIIDIQGSPRLLTVMTDITQRKLAEQKIKISEQRFRQLAELLPEMIFEANRKGKITFANNYLLSSFNSSPERLEKGFHITSLFNSKSSEIISKYLKNSLISIELPTVELTAVRENGEEFPALTHIIAIEENKKLSRFMGILVDITTRKQEELELIRAKKEAEEASLAKEKFLSTMSHEIRTPMNAIIGLTNILLQEDPLESQLKNIQTLKFSAENLMNLLNDILDFSKIEAGKLKINKQPLNINTLAQGVYNTFRHVAQKKGIELILNVDPGIPNTLLSDSFRLNQVLSNLTSNAIKFTDNGSVTIKIVLEKELKGSVTLLFSVSDTGIGVPAEKQKMIFQEFTQANIDTTRKYGGTGLGLAISQRLVTMMGGKIDIRSDSAKGSEFYFMLCIPKSKEVKNKEEIEQEVKQIHFDKPFRILVAEDNEINSMIVTKFLGSWGLEFDIADNGKIAVEKVKQATYDLILMDLEMPEMDGYDATIEIRRIKDNKKNQIPIVAFTASAMLDVQTKIFSLGMNGFVLKPFVPYELKKKIADMLNA